MEVPTGSVRLSMRMGRSLTMKVVHVSRWGCASEHTITLIERLFQLILYLNPVWYAMEWNMAVSAGVYDWKNVKDLIKK